MGNTCQSMFGSLQGLMEQITTLAGEKEKLKNFISDLEEQLTTVASSAAEEKQVLYFFLQTELMTKNNVA